jgi:hypothetical protein
LEKECDDDGIGLTVQDHGDDIESHAGVMNLTFAHGEDLNWASVQLIITSDQGTVICDNPGVQGQNCGSVQIGGQNGETWEKGEALIISDTGANFCNADCNLTIKILYGGEVIAWGINFADSSTNPTIPSSLSTKDIPTGILDVYCSALDTSLDSDEEEEASNEWWTNIPVAGEIIEQIQTKYGKMISAAVFGLGVIGYGYRAITLRSDMVMKKRMKKFEKRIDAARTSSALRRVQLEIEKADEKRLLPVGGFGDLMSMIELRAEDLGLADFLPKESLVAGASGISDGDFQEGMEAMRGAQDEMLSVAEMLREQKAERDASRGSKQAAQREQRKDLVSLKDMATGGGISLPSHHPKDFNRDGRVDDEDKRLWDEMSDEERSARTSGPFGGGDTGLTDQILAFSKTPSSSKAPCHCGSRKQYRKCHMNKDKCPCGSKKKFVRCCAKKRKFK